MFEQLDDPEVRGRKSWKERLTEAAIIVVAAASAIGALVFALIEIG